MNDNIAQFVPLPPVEPEGEWDPGFEGDRWLVVSRLGPWTRLFLRTPGYRKRWYHRVYNLPVQDWTIPCKVKFLAGLCIIDVTLEIRFQPTLRFVESNMEALPDVPAHIRTNFESLVRDAAERELHAAEEQQDWIDTGLETIERSIETSVNEMLVMQNIQCRSRCTLESTIRELSEAELKSMGGHFERQSVYLGLMRKAHEFESQRKMEIFRHEQEEEKAQLEHQRNLLDQFRRDEAVRQARDHEVTEQVSMQLREEEKRQSARQASEERRHTQRIEHEALLRKMELDAKKREREMRLQATKDSDDILRHEIELLVLEKQRHSLEEEVEDVVRQWDRKKIQEHPADDDDEQFSAIPPPADSGGGHR